MTDNQDKTQSLAYTQDTSGSEKQTNGDDDMKNKMPFTHSSLSLHPA